MLLQDIISVKKKHILAVKNLNNLIKISKGNTEIIITYTPTTLTCYQYAHHVVMNSFLNANNFRNLDFREWNPKKASPRLAHYFFMDSTLSNLCF